MEATDPVDGRNLEGVLPLPLCLLLRVGPGLLRGVEVLSSIERRHFAHSRNLANSGRLLLVRVEDDVGAGVDLAVPRERGHQVVPGVEGQLGIDPREREEFEGGGLEISPDVPLPPGETGDGFPGGLVPGDGPAEGVPVPHGLHVVRRRDGGWPGQVPTTPVEVSRRGGALLPLARPGVGLVALQHLLGVGGGGGELLAGRHLMRSDYN